jgi:hypothetical protein
MLCCAVQCCRWQLGWVCSKPTQKTSSRVASYLRRHTSCTPFTPCTTRPATLQVQSLHPTAHVQNSQQVQVVMLQPMSSNVLLLDQKTHIRRVWVHVPCFQGVPHQHAWKQGSPVQAVHKLPARRSTLQSSFVHFRGPELWCMLKYKPAFVLHS